MPPTQDSSPNQAIDPAALPDPEPSRTSARPVVLLLMGILFYQGYAASIIGIASPWVANSFGLDQSGIAAVFAWLALSALGALALARMVDRAGRRRVMFWCVSAMPLCALGAAISNRLVLLVVFAILLNALGAAAAASAIVIMAEVLPIELRAKGQSYAGIAGAAGGGLCLGIMPLLAGFDLSWRWLMVVAAGGILLFPGLVKALPESSRWRRASEAGDTARTRFADLFRPLYSKRSVALTITTIFGALCSEGATTWAYFHAVSIVGLSAGAASAMMFLGGGVGMLGFPAGAWSAEKFGRVPTVVTTGIAVAGAAILFYWGPPKGFGSPFSWLSVTFCLLSIVLNASTVAINSAYTELFPTSLRATSFGWFSLISAGAALSAESTISALAKPLRGLSNVVGWLAMLAIPGAIVFGLAVEETRGMTLEAAAKEGAFEGRAEG